MIGFCPLASGSKGNCIYLGTSQTKILIDAGLSGKATINKLAAIDVDVGDIDAILISHEHTDHVRGLKVLACRMGIPVFANNGTASGIVERIDDCPSFKIFSTGETFEFGDIAVHSFSVQHDAADPVAFTVHIDDIKLGFCTDLGFATSLVKMHLKDCDYLYVEANHQPTMVHACSRPMIYKQRVLGRCGHLSNEACGDLLREVVDTKVKHIHLAHLSQECNHPDTAIEVVSEKLEGVGHLPEISIAWQDKISKAVDFHASCVAK